MEYTKQYTEKLIKERDELKKELIEREKFIKELLEIQAGEATSYWRPLKDWDEK
jgi:hypothetical protein